jgi:hypothetical protein
MLPSALQSRASQPTSGALVCLSLSLNLAEDIGEGIRREPARCEIFRMMHATKAGVQPHAC